MAQDDAEQDAAAAGPAICLLASCPDTRRD
jgi:hypothetical protein